MGNSQGGGGFFDTNQLENANNSDNSKKSDIQTDNRTNSQSQSSASVSNTSSQNTYTANINTFNPTLTPSVNIGLNQNDSCYGRSGGNQTSSPRSDQYGSASTGAFSTDTRGGAISQSASQSATSTGGFGGKGGSLGVFASTAAAAGAGYLVGYGIGLSTSESTTFAAITGGSYIAGEMIAQQLAKGNDLVSVGISAAAGTGSLYYLGQNPGTGAMIAIAGTGAGTAVKYLGAKSF